MCTYLACHGRPWNCSYVRFTDSRTSHTRTYARISTVIAITRLADFLAPMTFSSLASVPCQLFYSGSLSCLSMSVPCCVSYAYMLKSLCGKG